MEKLALCSKILYDRDLLEKKKIISDLEYQLNLEKVKIICKNKEDLDIKINIFFKSIKKQLNNIIVDDYDQYSNIVYFGITSLLTVYLENTIFIELFKLTNKKYYKWCIDTSYNIVVSIDSIIQSLYENNKINDFNNEELSNYIYTYIKCQMYDKNNKNSILQGVIYYE